MLTRKLYIKEVKGFKRLQEISENMEGNKSLNIFLRNQESVLKSLCTKEKKNL